MRDRADTPTAPRPRAGFIAFAPQILTVAAVILAWQVVLQPLIQRAPVETAVRLAPDSPQALRRAAEAELIAGRTDNAAALSRDALGRAPFDVRALRVVGLTEARSGRMQQADDLLTLAGNWSLRDDPTHGWLVEHRLRRGDYGSAFAHADTLVRRREDIRPQIFNLFRIAAVQDSRRALPVVAGLLGADPSWRAAFLTSLRDTPDGLGVAVNLALLLQTGPAPLTNDELQQLYVALLDKGLVDAVKAVRGRLNRPPAGSMVTNGGFDDPAAPVPFQWVLLQKAGAVAAIMADDLTPANPALRVEYDGYATAIFAQQRTFLAPGRYRFSAGSRTEAGDPSGRMGWTITCTAAEAPLVSVEVAATAGTPRWAASAREFSVTSACPVQWLELKARPLDRQTPMVAWFDRVEIVPLRPTPD